MPSSRFSFGNILIAVLALLGLGTGIVYVAKREGISLPKLPKIPSGKDLFKLLPYAPLLPFAPLALPLVPGMLAVYAYTNSSDFTKRMQTALTQAGFPTKGIDGVWGGNTAAAAMGFQSSKGMPTTGLPDPPLAAALNVPLPAVPNFLGSGFASTLASEVNGIVQDPMDAVKLLLHESGLNPSATAKTASGQPVATGIFQLLVNSVPTFTGMPVKAFNALSAAAQVPFAARWWKQMASGFGAKLPVSGRDLYWLNYLPAAYSSGAPDSYMFVKNNDTYLNAKSKLWNSLPGVYSQNRNLDHGNKGYITAGDMALALNDGARANPMLYAGIANALGGATV